MRRPPIRIRTFVLGIILVVLLVPTLAAGVAWSIERDHQQAGIQRQLNTAVAYLSSHRGGMREPAAVQGFARLLDGLDLLAQLTLVTTTPPKKTQLYVSPALQPGQVSQTALTTSKASLAHVGQVIPITPSKPQAALSADLYYRPASGADRVLVALVSGILVLLAGLAAALWLAGRWMVAPLTRLSAEVDKVAGGDLATAVPDSRIAEITNIAQAVDGMTAALGQTAQRQAEADEARQFLVTSIAHDLRTPLFALRGHLQAIGSHLGDPAVHLQRAEARADALERLIGNLFSYTRDDYAQPSLRLEAVPLPELLEEVAVGAGHAARLRGNAFQLDGDQAIGVIVDRERVRRALANILDNAIRYSPTGAPIHLSWVPLDEVTVEITVQDHGLGIAPDLLPHIFEPGVRGAPAVGADGGSGLGLTIVKRLLEHQGATVRAHNEPTGGAVISLTLRRASPANSRNDRAAKTRGATRTERTL
jgi:signal transduction histidine kinase